MNYIEEILRNIERQNPNEIEYYQAVREVLESISEVVESNPQFIDHGIIERLTEPDRIYIFNVPWVDDQGKVKVNKGYRVQYNNALGPYMGGIRFHPNLNLSILKFLGFEQIFKNSLTGLSLGAAEGGANFDPRGKTDREIMRFCQAFMLELWKVVGSEIDVSAGDIGVGTREIGYMYGMYKKITREHSGVFTGKGVQWGGSLSNSEAPGYGAVYFVNEMLKQKDESIEGKRVAISGFGNVAWGVAKKVHQLGGKIITISGPDGYIYDPDGFDEEKIEYMRELRASNQDLVKPFSFEFIGTQFYQNKKPWEVPCDVAIPCAIQYELDKKDAHDLLKNNCLCVAEGANMPATPDAIEIFYENKVLFAPGKAVNAGGVAVSGLEMAQNAMKLMWSATEIDNRLQVIMKDIHTTCVQYGDDDGYINYVKGANIAGFIKVAYAMIDQGII
ncbi:MAG: NADP-specific glutamate dehydrogenase [Bacteroidota bacterium]|nr:NADP-specific glutamate dehydrogenase [Bacteroidota bacterium]